MPSFLHHRGIPMAPERYRCGISPLDATPDASDSRGVRIGVLGPLEIDEGSARLGSRDRIVLTALAMRPGELLTPEQLADAVWGDRPPASWPKNLQGCVSRLRKLLGPDAIETSAQGYRLRLSTDAVDVVEFSQLAARADELMVLREYEHARYVAAQALTLWRGRPLAELEQWEAGTAEVGRLCELHAALEELALEASLASGHHRDVLRQAAAMVEAAPLRERRWALLARAQYQVYGLVGDVQLGRDAIAGERPATESPTSLPRSTSEVGVSGDQEGESVPAGLGPEPDRISVTAGESPASENRSGSGMVHPRRGRSPFPARTTQIGRNPLQMSRRWVIRPFCSV